MQAVWTRLDAKLGLTKNRDLWFLALVLVGVALIYSTTMNGPFIYDDIIQIANNDKIRHLGNIRDIVFHAGRETRPLLNFFYAIAFWVSPGATWPYHAALIAIHMLNTALVFRLVRKIFSGSKWNRPAVIWTSTLLFAFHPLQVQGVSYIVGATSAIQFLFYLLCMNLYDSHNFRNDWKIRLTLAFSMLCKESCLLIPMVLVWWDFTLGGFSFKDFHYRRHVFFVLSSLSVMLPLYLLVSNPVTTYDNSTGFHLYPYGHYLFTQGYYYLLYLKLIFDSSSQSIIHPFLGFDAHIAVLGVAGGLLCGLMIFLAINLRKEKPLFSFIEMSNPFAEYRLYQSNLALFIGIACLVSLILSFVERPVLKAVALTGPLVWLLLNCYFMQKIWSSDISIYVYSQAVYPDAYEMTQLLGSYYEGHRAYGQAEEQYLKALALMDKPHGIVYFHPRHLLFRIYVQSHQLDKALKEVDLIEREVGGGQLPYEGYRAYLELLNIKKDHQRFNEVRSRATQHFPDLSFPEWGKKLTDPTAQK
jgi:hypothetical protein